MPVYFIQFGSDGPVKIGFTRRVERRFREIKASSPFPLVLIGVCLEGTREMEATLHRKYKNYRMHGEWFSPEKSIIETARSYKYEMLPSSIEPRLPRSMRPKIDIQSFRQMIEQWHRLPDLAKDVGVTTSCVRGWYNRDNIPLAYLDAVRKAARSRNYNSVTKDVISKLWLKRRKFGLGLTAEAIEAVSLPRSGE